jgi:hypothetical protein
MPSSRNLLALTGLLFAGLLSQPVASADPSGDYATDTRGYVNSSARCAEGQKAVAIGRTQRSKVVICSTAAGGYEYFGVRIADGAALQLDAEATDTGYQGTADGATYTVEPTELSVVSDGKVIYRDTWVDYFEPQYTATPTTPTTPPAPAAPRSWG